MFLDFFSCKQRKPSQVNKHSPKKKAEGRMERQVGKSRDRRRASQNNGKLGVLLVFGSDVDSCVGFQHLSTQDPEFWVEALKGPRGGHRPLTTEKRDPFHCQTHDRCSIGGCRESYITRRKFKC